MNNQNPDPIQRWLCTRTSSPTRRSKAGLVISPPMAWKGLLIASAKAL